MSRPEGEPRIPWYLLFSRSGRRPEEPSEAEDGILPAQESRSMSEREGRGAFLFWIAAGFVLCLLAALSAVSCGRHGEEQAESGSSVPSLRPHC